MDRIRYRALRRGDRSGAALAATEPRSPGLGQGRLSPGDLRLPNPSAVRGLGRLRPKERGVALLLALATTVALSLLALSVLASRQATVAVGEHADNRGRARRAAASGIEWALARAVAGNLTASTTDLVLDDGEQVRVSIDPNQSPHVMAVGRCAGVTARMRADLAASQPGTPPHAWVNLGGTLFLPADLTVLGSAHLNGALAPIALLQPGRLRMHGDLFLQTTSTIFSYAIVHTAGATSLGQPAIADPTVDLAAIPTAATGGVPVASYSGNTSLHNTSLSGIVRVTLAAGQTLDVSQVTLSGTLVVSAPSSLINPAKIKLWKVTLLGGTGITGNLAILAPNVAIEAGRSEVEGVTMVRAIADTDDTTFRGQTLTMLGAVANGFTIERPAGFVPNTPLGLSWGTPIWRLVWLDE